MGTSLGRQTKMHGKEIILVWTGPRQSGRHVYVTLERSLIKMGLDHATKVRTFDNKQTLH